MGTFSDVIEFLEKMNSKRLVILIILAIILLLLLPILESNFFYYNRLDNRIDILQSVSNLDKDKFEYNEILENEYKSILEEITTHEELGGKILATETTKTVKWLKFLTGSFWAVLLIFFSPFIYKSLKESLTGILLFIFIAIVLGGIGYFIPTFNNPFINYVGWPIIQLVILIVGLVIYSNKTKKP